MSIPDFKFDYNGGQAAVEKVVGEVEWDNEQRGLCECPGRERHAIKNTRGNCAVYLEAVTRLHCFHRDCGTVVQERTAASRRVLTIVADQGVAPLQF